MDISNDDQRLWEVSGSILCSYVDGLRVALGDILPVYTGSVRIGSARVVFISYSLKDVILTVEATLLYDCPERLDYENGLDLSFIINDLGTTNKLPTLQLVRFQPGLLNIFELDALDE